MIAFLIIHTATKPLWWVMTPYEWVSIFATIFGIWLIYRGLRVNWRKLEEMKRQREDDREQRIKDEWNNARDRLNSGSEALQIDALLVLKGLFDKHEDYQGRIFGFLLERLRELGKELEKCKEGALTIKVKMEHIMALLFGGEKTSMYAKRRAKEKNFEANMSGFHLKGLHLVNPYMPKVNLGAADLDGARLWGGHLEGANLHHTGFTEALLVGVYLEGAKLQFTRLEGAILSCDQLLDNESIKDASWNKILVHQPRWHKESADHYINRIGRNVKACHLEKDSFESGAWRTMPPFDMWIKELNKKKREEAG